MKPLVGLGRVGTMVMVAAALAGCKSDRTGDKPKSLQPGSTASGAAISEDAFAAMVLSRLKKLHPNTRFKLRKDTFSISWTRGGEPRGVANLRNAYDEYLDPKATDREGQLTQFVQMLARVKSSGIPLSSPVGLGQLMPQVRDLAFRDSLVTSVARVGGKGNEYGTVLAHHLFVTIVRDAPKSMSYVSDKDLSEAKLTRAGAMKRALANIRAKTVAKWTQPDRSVKMYESGWKDNYDAARILLTDLIKAKPVDGKHVVMVPHRDKLLVTGTNDVAGLKAAAKSAQASLNGPRPMSGIAFVLDGDRWKPWLPAPSHGAYKELKMTRALYFIPLYKYQKTALDKKYKGDKNPPFVASYRVYQKSKADPPWPSPWSAGA